ncbi:MAG: hypothetical protein JEZ09_19990 [Salinivirgaceae bacterium]|nr:hypothetical protein [Salinivirgaceae bacterium]
MKSMYKLLLGFVAIAALSVFVSCEGPEGLAGADGADGLAGEDANTVCLECHTSVIMDAIEGQFALHKHTTENGGAWGRGTSDDCAQCHSSEGFANFLNSGESIGVTNPGGLTCSSCHGNHSSLEAENIEAPLVTSAGPIAMTDGTTVFDNGDGNLCANCHQSRRPAGYYTDLYFGTDTAVAWNGTDPVNIPNSHAGPHHGPQANVIAGIDGFTLAAVTTEPHHASCNKCHMNDEEAGYGHSFVPNIASCNECHGDAVDVESMMTATNARITAVGDALVLAGALTSEDGEYSPNPGDVSPDVFKAWWNFMIIIEDRSKGMHNPDYIDALLSYCEDKL